MNKEVLKEVIVNNGHSYANDALMGIVSKFYPFDCNIIVMAHSNDEFNNEDYKLASKNMKLFNGMFDAIVNKGKEFALDFIKSNWSLYANEPWEDDKDAPTKKLKTLSIGLPELSMDEMDDVVNGIEKEDEILDCWVKNNKLTINLKKKIPNYIERIGIIATKHINRVLMERP